MPSVISRLRGLWPLLTHLQSPYNRSGVLEWCRLMTSGIYFLHIDSNMRINE